MWKQILIGIILVIITIYFHAEATRFIIQIIKNRSNDNIKGRKFSRVIWVSIMVLTMLSASIIEAIIWACCYLYLDAIKGFENAVYFSVVTITTLGYGDITLYDEWKLLSALEAAVGVIMFGWSTAIVISAVQYIYFPEQNKNK
ncbi:potassium channel family protein [Limibacter armeniacum]|uniref:potassium channel family protein n=1 Tax=Limibacter armeniacum TaxID=466084 RepID=UPI002FE68482